MQSSDAKTRDKPARLEIIGGATREVELAMLNQLSFTGKEDGRGYEQEKSQSMQYSCATSSFCRRRCADDERWQKKHKSWLFARALARNSLPEMQF